MRLLAPLLILLTVLFSFKSDPPKTHWYSKGLKGKVKQLSELWILNENDTIFTEIHYFNKIGELQKLEVVDPRNSPYTYYMTYDEDGYTKSITHKSNLGTILAIQDFTKEARGDTIIVKSKYTYNISKSQNEYENYFLNYLLVKMNNFTPLSYDAQTIVHEYDERQWEIKTKYYFTDGYKERLYAYEKTDRKGNWTRRKMYSVDSLEMIPISQIRKISYY